MIHQLVLGDLPPRRERVLFWRDDQRCWEIHRLLEFEQYIGNPELAWTYWALLPDTPDGYPMPRRFLGV